ncbi:MAG: hypothetical protein CMJ75_17095 [Planctomycetaceae bacterium]|nr:hypothetical protein [Planctomycetaceae bacterium]
MLRCQVALWAAQHVFQTPAIIGVELGIGSAIVQPQSSHVELPVVTECCQHKLERVSTGGLRQLVDEGSDREVLLDVADRSQPTGADVRPRPSHLQTQVGNVIGQVGMLHFRFPDGGHLDPGFAALINRRINGPL